MKNTLFTKFGEEDTLLRMYLSGKGAAGGHEAAVGTLQPKHRIELQVSQQAFGAGRAFTRMCRDIIRVGICLPPPRFS